jgi:hypothetical protein
VLNKPWKCGKAHDDESDSNFWNAPDGHHSRGVGIIAVAIDLEEVEETQGSTNSGSNGCGQEMGNFGVVI